MANTGYILPQSVVTAAESPWLDDNWVSPGNVIARDGTEASITNNTYDNGDQSYVLKAYNFDFSGIPTGSTIDGVMCRIRARDSVAADIDLVQILDTSLAKVGTNMAATPVSVTTTLADYEFGGATDQWGNTLTESWIKNSNFGVAFGMINRSNNADVFCDSIELDVYYTAPGSSVNATPSTGELTITGYAPTVTVTENKKVTPSTGEVTLTGYAPTVSVSDHKTVITSTGEITITGYAPTVTVSNNINIITQTGSLILTGQAAASTVKGLKYYAGGTWVEKPLKYWNGSAWEAKELKVVKYGIGTAQIGINFLIA